MKKLLTIIKTDLQLEFTYPITWVFFLGIPILFTLIIGVAMGGANTSQSPSENPVPLILVIDLDQTNSSNIFVEYLSEQKGIGITVVPSLINAEQQMAEGNHSGILTIPTGFESAYQEGTSLQLPLQLGGKDFTTVAIENAVRSALDQQAALWKIASGSMVILTERVVFSEQEYQEQFNTNLESARNSLDNPLFTITRHAGTTGTQSQEIMNGFNQSSAGQLVTWTLITLLSGSVIFALERENGTYQRLMSTPTSRFTYFSGKLLSRLLMGMVQMTLLVIFGTYILKVDWGDAPLTLLLFLACFGFTGTAFGLMLGSFVKTSKQADTLTPVFSMLLASLGGAWWPLEITPPLYQTVVRVLPTTWAMIGFNDIIIKRQGFSGVLPEMLVLLGFGTLFTVVGILKMGRKTK